MGEELAIQSRRMKELVGCDDDAIEEEDLLRECVLQLEGKISQDLQQPPQHLDTTTYYLENLKAQLCSVEAQNAKVSDEIDNLTMAYLEDSIQLQTKLNSSQLDFIHSRSQGLETQRQEYQLQSEGASKFKISELHSQLEKKKGVMESLEKLDYTLKRFEGFLRIEDMFTGLQVIEYHGNRISLSLSTYVPEIEMAEQNHELAIQVLDGTLELKNAEISPNDVYIGEIIDAAKSFEHQFSLLSMSEKTSLEWFVRRVQDKIVLSTLRKYLVKAASKSRHSIEYVDKDEIIVAHMLDGVEAYIKVSQGWPITSSPLKLLFLKGSSQSSKEVTFSFLCNVEEKVNSLDVQVCQNLSTFMDAIEEIFMQRVRIEIQSDSSINK